MRGFLFLPILALLSCSNVIGAEPQARLNLTGPYLGQKLPGKKPEIFAPGIVNTGMYTRDLAMTPDGKEIYFSVVLGAYARSTIVSSRLEGGRWTEPEVAPFATDPRWRASEPAISSDGKQFFFSSDRSEDPKGEKHGPFGIWVMDREGSGWSEARRLPALINAKPAYFPSVTRAGTLYFSREETQGKDTEIWRARRGSAGYLEPERLPAQVNCGKDRYNAWISPDESLLILGVFGGKDGFGGTDYYVVFRRNDDAWSEPINLGGTINSADGDEYSASLSPDGRFFFFMSGRIRPDIFAPGEELSFRKLRSLAMEPGANGNSAIYWMEAGFLEELRKKAVFEKK